MKLSFTKMHGIGNDFILIDCRDMQLAGLPGLAKRLCDRRFGIGADQILLLGESAAADFSMRIFNADGSEVEMCGNGIRCLAKYVWDRGLSDKETLRVETPGGIIQPERAGELVRVDMGEPVLEGRLIPVNLNGEVKGHPLQALDREFRITCVSMGNPHAVIFVDGVEGLDVERYGSVIERHELFPKRTNVEFIEVIGRDRIRMRVWERGAGETLACGTGACAAAVASHLNGHTGRRVSVELRGGVLHVEWREDNRVFMTGPAAEVFEGVVEA